MPGFGSLGGSELLIALVIILLLFGAKRIPELAKGLGTGISEFRKGTRGEIEDEDKKDDEEKKEDEKFDASEEKSEPRMEDGSSTAESDRAETADRAEQKRG